uniref:Uncharacterized protein n=1 Tax=Cacopsylla melanoneura TaxID=428564 RepID=A0A8D8LFS5_9HEMI
MDLVDTMRSAKSSIIRRFAHVQTVLPAMLSVDAIPNLLNLNNLSSKKTRVTVHPMQNVETVFVSVCLTIMEMVMFPVDLNVSSTVTVPVIKLVSGTSVRIHVHQELVERAQSAKY